MAEVKTIINKDRNKLEEVIPLDTPYSIYIDPSNLCNFKCNFCAMQTSSKSKNIPKQCMSFNMLKKIIDDITKFKNKIKIIRMTVNGEPLFNKELPDMIAYAKEKGVADYIEIITNGSLLNKEFNRKLIDSGIDRIRISIEALDAKGYEEIAGIKINFDRFLDNIKDLYENKKQYFIHS